MGANHDLLMRDPYMELYSKLWLSTNYTFNIGIHLVVETDKENITTLGQKG